MRLELLSVFDQQFAFRKKFGEKKKRKKKKTNVWGRIALNEVLQIAIEWKTFEKN